MNQIAGRYFAAGTSASIAATLTKTGNRVEIELDVEEDYPAAAVTAEVDEISDRLGQVARKIVLKDGSVFETPDNDGVDALFEIGNGFLGWLNHAEKSVRLIVITTVLTAITLVGLYRYGLPAIAVGAANATPPSVISLLDSGALLTVDKAIFKPSILSSERQDNIRGLFDLLVEQSGESRIPLNILFRNGGRIGANAFALPGGTIVITDELIWLAKSDDEIAGVLGHEIGHVEYRHQLRQIYRVLGIGFMISIIGGDSGQLFEDVITQVAAIEQLTYSRKFETESDYRSAELMVGLGRDPFAFIVLLQRITGKDRETSSRSWISTHPGLFERQETVEKYLETLNE